MANIRAGMKPDSLCTTLLSAFHPVSQEPYQKGVALCARKPTECPLSDIGLLCPVGAYNGLKGVRPATIPGAHLWKKFIYGEKKWLEMREHLRELVKLLPKHCEAKEPLRPPRVLLVRPLPNAPIENESDKFILTFCFS